MPAAALACGLCLPECPLEAIFFKVRPEPLPPPPAHFVELMTVIAREKGKTYLCP